ncbi:ATP-citrate lyase beta-subunit [Candidatus Methanophagaceae archaeon]|nr:ATP-citrate lyase beta-subunit [Methanophagales archaeon]
MAQRGIREYDAKNILAKHMKKLSKGTVKYRGKVALVTPNTSIAAVAKKKHWVKTNKLTVKPDQLFGKRGKHGLLLVNVTYDEAKDWLDEKMNSIVEVGKVKGKLTHFLVQPYVELDKEYYLAFTGYQDGDYIHFSSEGGVDIETNWDKVTTINVPIDAKIEDIDLTPILDSVSSEDKKGLKDLVTALYLFYRRQQFGFLEFNPFTYRDGEFFPIDTVARLDDTAQYLCHEKWGDIEFPAPFGRELRPEEQYIDDLDEKSGSSLKLTVLNPHGRVWTMVAGGGASVIYADTVVDLGFGDELATYGEYSGNPTTEETYDYAKTLLDLMTREKVEGGKVLLIGGGIANFTDVALTFDGIIMALENYADKIKEHDIKIYIRRGGPNYEAGLAKIREAGKILDLDMEVHGPDMHMTKVVSIALKNLDGGN